MLTLRSYQKEAINAVFDYYRNNDGNCIISIPTGTGKSLIQAEILRRCLSQKPSLRFLCLAHVKELLEQNEQELLSLWPTAPVGVYSAGLNRKEDAPILIAGIQSIYKDPPPSDVVIVDEVHRFSDDPDSMYMQLYEKMGRPRMIGMTATPFRTKKGLLTKSEVWDKIVYSAQIERMIKDGFLCRVTTKQSNIQPDLSAVKETGGDYIMSQAQEAMIWVHEEAIDEIVKLGANRKHWLVFACNVEHAFTIKNSLDCRGIETAVVVGEMPSSFRDKVIDEFKSGLYRCLVNVNILTTGFNFKAIDLIATLRPTKSAIIYVQSVGRGMRTEEGKEDCLVLDYAGWINEFGPIDLVKVSARQGFNVAPHKTCPSCKEVVPIRCEECPDCGHIFEIEKKETKHNRTASTQSILSFEAKEYKVIQTTFVKHHPKHKDIPSMKVMYSVGMFQHYSEWVCFEHEDYPRKQAVKWWSRFGQGRTPLTVDEALSRTGEITPAPFIKVVKEGKWNKVIWT